MRRANIRLATCTLSRIVRREMQLKDNRRVLNGRTSAKNAYLCVKRARIFFYKYIYGRAHISKQQFHPLYIKNMLDRCTMEFAKLTLQRDNRR